MTTTISIFNQKGGSGKTTTTIAIAGVLSKMYDTKKHSKGKGKILVIDADPSGGATGDLDHSSHPKPDTYYADLIIDYCREEILPDPRCSIVPTEFPYLDLMPASNRLGAAQQEIMVYALSRNKIFRKIFANLDNYYDYILIDTMGAKHNALTINSLYFSDYAIIPLEPEKKNLKGYKDSFTMIKAIQDEESDPLQVLGVFYTKIDMRRSTDRFLVEEGHNIYGDNFINIPIHQVPSIIRDASNASMPVNYFAPSNKITNDYELLTRELLRRIEKMEGDI